MEHQNTAPITRNTMAIRESQIEKIIRHRRVFFTARDDGDPVTKGQAAAALWATLNNASDEEKKAAWDRMPAQCPCGSPDSRHRANGRSYCSEECARVESEWRQWE